MSLRADRMTESEGEALEVRSKLEAAWALHEKNAAAELERYRADLTRIMNEHPAHFDKEDVRI